MNPANSNSQKFKISMVYSYTIRLQKYKVLIFLFEASNQLSCSYDLCSLCTGLPTGQPSMFPRYHVSNDLCTVYTVQNYRTGLPSMYQYLIFLMIYVHCTELPYWTAFYVPIYQVSNDLCTLYRATVLDCLLCTKISSFK